MELANGNKAVNIPYVSRADEIGDTARAARTFKENLQRMEQLEATQKETEERAAEERRAAMHMLADEFEAVVGKIIQSVSSDAAGLESAAGTLTATAETTQQLSGIVASTSEEASANVHSVATSTEELAASINEIGRQVHESSQIAGDAVKQAEKTDARINQLSQAAQRIGDVVKLINAVAEQTNLLALNATIEAARAGEAGKGFAVVAQEVKALANQTAKATDEISAQISGMQAATRELVSAIKEIGETIDRVSSIASTIAAAVEQQGAAMQDIARNVQQAAEGTAHVAKQHCRGQPRRGRDRLRLRPGSLIGAIALDREQPSQGRSREVSRDRARGLTCSSAPLRPPHAALTPTPISSRIAGSSIVAGIVQASPSAIFFIVPRRIFPERVFGSRATMIASLNAATGPIFSRTSTTSSRSISPAAG